MYVKYKIFMNWRKSEWNEKKIKIYKNLKKMNFGQEISIYGNVK